MCWNAEVSFLSFLLIAGVSYRLYERNLYNDRLLAFFIVSYGTVQLFETFMWLGQKKWKVLNFMAGIFTCILLSFHPLAILLGIYYDRFYTFIKHSIQFKLFGSFSILLIFYTLLQIVYHLFFKYGKPYTFVSYPDTKTGHLVWNIPSYYHLSVILSILIILFISTQNKFLFTLLIFLYYLLPFYLILLYDGKKFSDVMKIMYGKFKTNDKYYGSFWCWISAFFSFLMYFINPYLQPNLR
jgi:hypothetical protein